MLKYSTYLISTGHAQEDLELDIMAIFAELAVACLPRPSGAEEERFVRLFLMLNYVMPNTHRRRRRDSTVELSRVGGVNVSR